MEVRCNQRNGKSHIWPYLRATKWRRDWTPDVTSSTKLYASNVPYIFLQLAYWFFEQGSLQLSIYASDRPHLVRILSDVIFTFTPYTGICTCSTVNHFYLQFSIPGFEFYIGWTSRVEVSLPYWSWKTACISEYMNSFATTWVSCQFMRIHGCILAFTQQGLEN